MPSSPHDPAADALTRRAAELEALRQAEPRPSDQEDHVPSLALLYPGTTVRIAPAKATHSAEFFILLSA